MQQGIDYIGVCVVFFCHDGKGNVLLGFRNKNTRDEQERWDIGGGGLEFGQPVEESLRREIKEEYDAEVLKTEFLGFRDVHRKLKGKPTHWIALDYKVLIDPTNVKNNEPHKFNKVEWFAFNKLPQPMHSQWPAFLEQHKEKLL
jgi:ADP-ribose pyrophosphatase YjhB (NUDIX family)